MKSIGSWVGAAVALAALGAVALTGGLIEQRIARADEALASLDFAETERVYDELESYAGYARIAPWTTGDALLRIRARRAAVRYWDGDYEALASLTRDATEGEQPDPELLFVAANAMYRLGRQRASDRQAMLRALDDVRGIYQIVLKDSAADHADAAFNYEFLARVRDEIAKGGRQPASNARPGGDPPAGVERRTLHGREGAPAPGRPEEEFQLYVPESEDEKSKGLEPGTDQLRQRKG